MTVVYPLGYTMSLAFQSQRLLGTSSVFVGFKTFQEVLSNPVFRTGLRNSLVWTLGNALLQGMGGMTVALLLNQKFLGKGVLRIWVIVPWIIPTVVMAIMWKWMLSSTFGVIGWLLTKTGFSAPPVFLGSPVNALPTLIFVNAWRWIPFMAVVILAALQTIPLELYEAADVDGTGAVGKFLYITLPSIQGTMSTMLLIGTLFSFNMFDVVWLMTEGGPLNTTTTLPVLIYKTAFKLFRVSQAAAISVIVFLLLAVFVILISRLESLKNLENED
jgi:multiple sugar transport system permease protein